MDSWSNLMGQYPHQGIGIRILGFLCRKYLEIQEFGLPLQQKTDKRKNNAMFRTNCYINRTDNTRLWWCIAMLLVQWYSGFIHLRQL